MPGNNIRILETLRFELKLVELGLYGISTAGRPPSIFADSPICRRYQVDSCPNCELLQFVPYACRFEPIPCHHIQLNEARETVDSLYRTGTQQELEEALRDWLTATIKKLEQEEVRSGNGALDRSLRNSAEKDYGRRPR
jgi:hypothetical protein